MFLVFLSLLTGIKSKSKWKQHGITVAGGNGKGNQLNQLYYPQGVLIETEKIMYIPNNGNHRIIQWKYGEKMGEIIAGENGKGNRMDQLWNPTDIIFDKQNNALIIADHGNRRVMRWSIQNKTKQEILISDIDCFGLATDKDGSIYVSDNVQNEIRRWKEGEKQGTLVAGGNGKGENLNQLDYPNFIFVDDDYSLYVSDENNCRVIKWVKDAQEGVTVAGGNGDGTNNTQLSHPQGILVDDLGQIYVADFNNNRVMRWNEESTEGEIIVGGNGWGQKSNQFFGPINLSFDTDGNLYVVDRWNHRIQKFEKDLP